MSSVATSDDSTLGGVPEPQVAMPRGRRRTEILMLVFSVLLVAFAYVNVGLGFKGTVPPGVVEYIVGFMVLLAIGHVAVRWLAPYADPLLLPLAATLNGLGIVMIYRLQESGRNGNPGQVID